MNHFVVTCSLKGQENLLERCKSSVIDNSLHIKTVIRHIVKVDPIEESKRKYTLYNIINALSPDYYRIGDDDLIHIVDGDDYIFPDALKKREMFFRSNPKYLLAYGGYRCESGARAKFQVQWNGQDLRKNYWLSSHMRTFKYRLWKKVPHSLFLDQKVEYFKTCADMATMWPMMEIAGPDRCKCLTQTCYIYNDLSPLNDHKVRREQQIKDEKYLRSLSPLKRIENI